MGININYHRHRNHIASEADTKRQKILKYILSFLLSVMLTVLSVCVCSEYVFLSPGYLEKSFTSYEYTAELHKNIELYAANSCKRAGVSEACLEDVVTFKAVKNMNDAFIGEQLEVHNRFNNETYDYFAGILKADIKAALLKQPGVADAAEAERSVNRMADDIMNYVFQSVSISHTEKLMSVISVTDIALKAVIAVLAVLCVLFTVIIYYTGERRYRGLRFAAYSFGAAALINAAFAAIAKGYARGLALQIYPEYLQFALESHIQYCVFAFICAAAAMLAAYTAVLAFCWKLKRKNK